MVVSIAGRSSIWQHLARSVPQRLLGSASEPLGCKRAATGGSGQGATAAGPSNAIAGLQPGRRNVPEWMSVGSHEWKILAEVALAMVLGGVIGLEREIATKPAGFRTHMLVAGASALLAGLAFSLLDHSLRITGTGAVAADPIRILQAITIGVSFLGAGTIVRGGTPTTYMASRLPLPS